MAIRVADQLVSMLLKAGIKRIYAITGDSLNEFNDAVRKHPELKWIHVRNEEAGAFAASADAQLSGLACCAGSSGPGHVHLVNGLYDAQRSGAAVLAIASTCATKEFGSGYFQETNVIKLFDDCSHYTQVAANAQQFPRMAQAALQTAIQKKGVAVLGLPGDIAGLPAADIDSSTDNFFSKASICPAPDELQALAALIDRNPRICIFCGIGAAEAHDEVVQLAGWLKAPVGFSFRGKMAIEYDNPYEVGMTGLLGLPSAYHSMHESDLVLLLGTDFPYTPFYPQDKKIVQVDIRPENLGRRTRLTMGLFGDVKTTVKALMPLLKEKTDRSFLDAQLHIHEKVKDHLATYVQDKGKTNALHPEAVAAAIDLIAADDAIFTCDTGMCNVWSARYIRANGKRKMIGSFVHGSMANAMPHAIGASLACPGRQVVALCGDGGISMLLGELATIRQYSLPIKLIVFNNRSLGMVKLEMEVMGLPDFQVDMVDPDFVKVADAMGFKGITINEPEQIGPGLQEAFSTAGPVLVNVFTDPAALSMPPHIELKMVKGMALSMTKMMLGGKFEEVLATVKGNYKHLAELLD
ncbi:thiamine pyrophosphate-dependent enzyme [Flavitalea sp. BT771]|uniref:thiamine pyrophosphate-dependent enzyme n=1 Tax=Flavitalea sp. BT771 TaxID=3063329 RepID=UPI0026E403F3|nr:thiamine pyrophosphate-dependent enzyme [Flavitalea sp. BT771]MDO6430444.1 thiamine pyrophosphate-dependent enzyme [Flavitalea sp. BT771]MDV6219416.1 thiamine pyrophosphate-dependent enzyme [Flavitalea sp. BT771]